LGCSRGTFSSLSFPFFPFFFFTSSSTLPLLSKSCLAVRLFKEGSKETSILLGINPIAGLNALDLTKDTLKQLRLNYLNSDLVKKFRYIKLKIRYV